MNITNKKRLANITVFMLIVIIAATIFWAYTEVAVATRQRQQTSEMARSMSELRLLTLDFLINRQQAARLQWYTLSDHLDRVIAENESSGLVQEKILAELRRKKSQVQSIFAQSNPDIITQMSSSEMRRQDAQLLSQLVLDQRQSTAYAFHLTDLAVARIHTVQRRMMIVTLAGLFLIALLHSISLAQAVACGLQPAQGGGEHLRLALAAAHMGTFDWVIPHNHITWSRWHEELWGFQPGEFGGTYESFSQRVHPDDLPGINAEVTRCIAAHELYQREFRVLWPDGSIHWIAARGEFTFAADGQPLRMSGVVMEITERKQVEAEVERMAYHDTLTNLPNRAALHIRLQQATQQAHGSGRSMALLLMDLNNFREINDTLGHHNGDQILVQVADRLRRVLWDADVLVRLGGDEFAVLLPRMADQEHIQLVLSKILGALHPAFMIEGAPLDVQAAIGIALYPDHGQDADTLLRHADVALYDAKDRNLTHLLYNSASDNYNPPQLALMAELRLALQREELVLHYQPVVDIKSGQVVGVEALVRWQHLSRGLLYPDTFIPAAEKTRLIAPLTTWVMANALRQQHRWQRAGINLNVSVNLSVRNLQQADIVVETRDILISSGVKPERLTLEITESAIMIDPVHAKAALTELHELGIHIAIDDFGIGQSSLAYLKNLPVDKLKVDKSFVMDFNNPANAVIVRATIDMAHNLGLEVTAEGVEDCTTLAALKNLGCDIAQGYHIAHPMPASEVVAWLKNWTTTTTEA